MGAPVSASRDGSLQKLQQGHPEALNELIERWQQPLHKFAYQYVQNASDAKDLVAETFVRLYHQRNRLRPDTNLSAWLFTALANLCCNQYRWKQRHPTISLDAPITRDDKPGAALQASAELEPNRALENDETLAALHEAIEGLPHDLKAPLLLYHYNKLSYKEISKIIRCSTRGVETRLYRAKQRLRAVLANHLSDGIPTPLTTQKNPAGGAYPP